MLCTVFHTGGPLILDSLSRQPRWPTGPLRSYPLSLKLAVMLANGIATELLLRLIFFFFLFPQKSFPCPTAPGLMALSDPATGPQRNSSFPWFFLFLFPQKLFPSPLQPAQSSPLCPTHPGLQALSDPAVIFLFFIFIAPQIFLSFPTSMEFPCSL